MLVKANARFGYMPVHTNMVYLPASSPSAWTGKEEVKMIVRYRSTLSDLLGDEYWRKISNPLLANDWPFVGTADGHEWAGCKEGSDMAAWERSGQAPTTCLMPPPFPSALFLHLPPSFCGGIAFYQLSISNYELYLSLSIIKNLRVRGTPTPRGSHQNSEIGCRIMCVELLTLLQYFLLGTCIQYVFQFIIFLIARFSSLL